MHNWMLKRKSLSLILAIAMVISMFLPGFNVKGINRDGQAMGEDKSVNLQYQGEKENNNKETKETKIQLIGFNDFHGNIIESGKNVGAAKFVGEINRLKAENPNTFVISAGDIYQGTAISNLLYGEPESKMLKELDVKYSAVGNHEFDWGLDKISKWKEDAGMDFLAANVYDKKTGQPVHWAKPYGIIEASGKKIAILGLTTPETAFKTKLENVEGLEFKDIIKSANYWVDYLRNEKKVDSVVVVGHIGSHQDPATGDIKGEAVDLANNVKGIDAIISAHTHMFVEGKVNNIPVIQAGNNGRGLSKVTLTFNEKGNLSVEGKLDKIFERVSKLPEDGKMKEIIEKYKKELGPIMQEVVVNVDSKLDHDRFAGLSPLGQFSTKYMAKAANTEIAITNGGGLRRPVNAGNITVGDMWEVMPFDNTLIKMKLKGSDLKRVIETGIMNDSIGWGQFYGLKVYYDKEAEAGKRITSMRLLDGTKIEDNKYYTVATNDFIYNKGDNYDFSGAIDVVDTQTPLRDLLIKTLSALKNVSFKFDDTTLVSGKDPVVDMETLSPSTEIKQNGQTSSNEEVKPNEEIKPNESVKKQEVSKINNKTSNNKNKETKLPKTGSLIDPNIYILIGFILVIGGIIVVAKKNNNEDVI